MDEGRGQSWKPDMLRRRLGCCRSGGSGSVFHGTDRESYHDVHNGTACDAMTDDVSTAFCMRSDVRVLRTLDFL